MSSKTIVDFCREEKISKSVYYDLKKRGLGPDEFEIPSTRIKRITPEAHAAWRARMAELAKSEAAKLEADRRREIAAVAGRIAAQSPRHISRRHGARSAITARQRSRR
jgi:hypothetical protein